MTEPIAHRIGGAVIGGPAGRTIHDPATGATIAIAPEAGPAVVDAAVAAASAALPGWAATDWPTRRRALLAFADAIERDATALAALETRNQGQPTWAAQFSVAGAVDHLRYHAGLVGTLHGIAGGVSIPGVDFHTVREPLGVVGIIVPWNFPITIAVWKLAPALAAGNTVVLKPADDTPLTALRIADLAAEAGLPPGVLNVVLGGAATGAAIVEHPGVDAVSFTGSTAVGRRIGAVAGGRPIPAILELGGKTPGLLLPGADVDAAVSGILLGGLYNAGQTCAAFANVHVHRSQRGEVVDALAAALAGLRLGPGDDPRTGLTPLTSLRHRDHVVDAVARAVADGARLVTGATSAPDRDGYYAEPSLLDGVAPDADLATREVFGPVLGVIEYDDVDEAIARIDASPYTLAAGIFGADLAEAARAARRVRAGTVWVNPTMAYLDAVAPWGGYGASGTGKELGQEGLLALTRTRSVFTTIGAGA